MTDPQLSRREREIAQLMAEGFSYSEIAAASGMSTENVRFTAWRLAERLPGTGSPVVRIVRWWCLTNVRPQKSTE